MNDKYTYGVYEKGNEIENTFNSMRKNNQIKKYTSIKKTDVILTTSDLRAKKIKFLQSVNFLVVEIFENIESVSLLTSAISNMLSEESIKKILIVSSADIMPLLQMSNNKTEIKKINLMLEEGKITISNINNIHKTLTSMLKIT